MSWEPLPEPLSWPIDPPIAEGGLTYAEVVLRAPIGENILKATALPGASNADVTVRLIEAVSGVPYDVLKKIPWHLLKQMSDYLDEFAGVPAPDPLEAWRARRREREAVLANAIAATEESRGS